MSNLAIYLLSIEECCTLSERLLSVLKTCLSTESSVKKVLPYLKKLNENLTALMARVSNAESTRKIGEKDAARDAAFVGFRNYCKAFISMPDPRQAAAARKLEDLIRQLGWTLYSEGYTEQTASLQGLFEALEKPEYVEAIAAIEAEAHLANLKAAQAEFEAAVALKTEAATSQNDIPTARECKQQMSRYLQPLLYHIGLMADVDPNNYANVNAKITEIIEDVVTVARARQTRKENQQTEEKNQSVS